jgi:hypothetical protein
MQPMGTIVNLNDYSSPLPESIKKLIAERKNAKREPLTPDKVRKTPGLENLSDKEVEEAIDSVKRLTGILFEMACHKESICIDNLQVINLNQQNKAA